MLTANVWNPQYHTKEYSTEVAQVIEVDSGDVMMQASFPLSSLDMTK